MGSSHKLLAIVSVGASLVAFTALVSASPGGRIREAAAGSRRAPAGGASCRSGDGAEGACCPDATGRSARLTVLLAQRDRGPAQPTASKKPSKASPTSLAKGIATRKALLDQVSAMMEDGLADCCIDPGCAFCPIAADRCPCAGSLTKGGPVCPECWGGWQTGQGMLPDVKPEKVQILPKDRLKKIYDLKAAKLEQAAEKK